MRIVATADTHLFHRDLGPIPDGDLFVHAGDLLQVGTLEELADAAAWLNALPHRHKVIIAGNHDWCFQRDLPSALALLGEDVVYLQDSGHTVGGLSIWGSPWQPTFGGLAFNLDRGWPLRQKWDLIPEGTDLLITHGPPHGIGDLTAWDLHVGCGELRQAVRRVAPTLHLFGHIHEAPGSWTQEGTRFVNVASNEGERGAWVIDVS